MFHPEPTLPLASPCCISLPALDNPFHIHCNDAFRFSSKKSAVSSVFFCWLREFSRATMNRMNRHANILRCVKFSAAASVKPSSLPFARRTLVYTRPACCYYLVVVVVYLWFLCTSRFPPDGNIEAQRKADVFANKNCVTERASAPFRVP
jgi:hypothetical protein